MATSLKKSITRNRMTGTEQPDEILLSPTEIGGSVKYSMGITKPFRTDTANWADPAIQPTIAQFKNSTVPGHSDHKNSPPSIFWIVVLMLPDPGGILITAVGCTHRDPS